MANPYTNDEVNKIIRMRVAGVPPKEIASIVSRTKEAIDRLLSTEKNRRDIIYPRLVKSDTKWTRQAIEEMISSNKGRTYKEIGNRFGISAPRVAYLFAKRAHYLQQSSW